MATYTKVYNNPYPDGWKDGKDGDTPVTADILNNQTETLESIEQYLADNPIGQGGGTGTTNYEDLTNKPSINGTELSGDITLDIPEKTSDLTNDSGFLTDIKGKNYNDLSDKPKINGIDLQGNLTVEKLGLQANIRLYSSSVKGNPLYIKSTLHSLKLELTVTSTLELFFALEITVDNNR